jgi:hypothetical protein
MAPAYPLFPGSIRVQDVRTVGTLDESLGFLWPIEGQLRLMCDLQPLRSAWVISADHAFVQSTA